MIVCAHVCPPSLHQDPDLGYTQGMCFAAGVVCLGPGDLEEKQQRFCKLMGDLRPLANVDRLFTTVVAIGCALQLKHLRRFVVAGLPLRSAGSACAGVDAGSQRSRALAPPVPHSEPGSSDCECLEDDALNQ